jgi:hypothetical protein
LRQSTGFASWPVGFYIYLSLEKWGEAGTSARSERTIAATLSPAATPLQPLDKLRTSRRSPTRAQPGHSCMPRYVCMTHKGPRHSGAACLNARIEINVILTDGSSTHPCSDQRPLTSHNRSTYQHPAITRSLASKSAATQTAPLPSYARASRARGARREQAAGCAHRATLAAPPSTQPLSLACRDSPPGWGKGARRDREGAFESECVRVCGYGCQASACRCVVGVGNERAHRALHRSYLEDKGSGAQVLPAYLLISLEVRVAKRAGRRAQG